jgi:hypothetical protein
VEDAFAIVRRQGTAFPGSTGGTATPSLHVIVTFTDDAGVVGAIGFPITTLKSTSN